jgi:osmoprotectant transport system substrate-binding protein
MSAGIVGDSGVEDTVRNTGLSTRLRPDRMYATQGETMNRTRLLALLMAVGLILAACGGGEGGGEGAGGAGPLADVDFSGVDVAVGSKDFTEQLVLGKIMVVALQELGANVDDKVNLGGTAVAREALLSGEIDTYMEYNGTGYSLHLAIEEPIPGDSAELTEIVRERDLDANGIQWLNRSPFNDTYGFASSPALTEENGGAFDMQSMADFLAANPDASLCLESEFPSRPDGLILFEEATGYDVPDGQITVLDTAPIYAETAANNCDFGEVFTTDGRIPALELTVVEDPGVMIIYNVSMNVRDEKYQEAPEAFDTLAEALLAPLDNDRMQELNRRVDDEGLTPDDVARQFLIDEGLING